MSEKKRQKSVYIYLVILFAVALLLMAYSMMMNKRTHQQTLAELRDSSSSLQNYMERVESLEEQLARTEQERDAERLSGYEWEKKSTALAYLSDLEYQYREKEYEKCREIAKLMEPFAEYLPIASLSGGIPSPADRYKTICEELNKTTKRW